MDSLEKVLEAAEWGQHEKTAVWYRAHGVTLIQCSLSDHAIDYFQKTLPSSWLDRCHISEAYRLKQQFDLAIELDKIIMEELQTRELPLSPEARNRCIAFAMEIYNSQNMHEEITELQQKIEKVQLAKFLLERPSLQLTINMGFDRTACRTGQVSLFI